MFVKMMKWRKELFLEPKHIKLGDIPTRISELSKDKEYVMVCRSGGRSNRAGVQLEEQGYNVKNLQGGMLDWDGDVSK